MDILFLRGQSYHSGRHELSLDQKRNLAFLRICFIIQNFHSRSYRILEIRQVKCHSKKCLCRHSEEVEV